MNKPDFEALRAKRNASVMAQHQKMADEYGIPLQSLRSNFSTQTNATAPVEVNHVAPVSISGMDQITRAKMAAALV